MPLSGCSPLITARRRAIISPASRMSSCRKTSGTISAVPLLETGPPALPGLVGRAGAEHPAALSRRLGTAVRLVDIHPDGSRTRISVGVLNLSTGQPRAARPMPDAPVTIGMTSITAARLNEGHRLGVRFRRRCGFSSALDPELTIYPETSPRSAASAPRLPETCPSPPIPTRCITPSTPANPAARPAEPPDTVRADRRYRWRRTRRGPCQASAARRAGPSAGTIRPA